MKSICYLVQQQFAFQNRIEFFPKVQSWDSEKRTLLTYFLKVPYQIGEVFVTMTQDDVQDTLEAQKEIFEGEVTKLEEKSEDIKSQMSDLKTQLYAKFGNAINLEADDES